MAEPQETGDGGSMYLMKAHHVLIYAVAPLVLIPGTVRDRRSLRSLSMRSIQILVSV